MSYKTILVHLNDERRARNLVELAAELARTFEAHLIGLHVFPAFRLIPPVPMPIGSDIVAGIRARIREETDRIRSLFEETTRTQPFVSEWRAITSERTDPELIVADQGRIADVIVAAQTDPEWDLSPILDFPERLALDGGRPVLVVANGGRFASVPRRISVAWNRRREAARAVFDALPLLRMAEKVNVLTVDDDGNPREGSLPDTELAAALARHGVDVTIGRIPASDASAGDEILREVAEQNSDLLVMGAYGHSRLREFVFGGATRQILRDMTCPVLFSH